MPPNYSATNSIDGLRRKTVNGETRLAISPVRTILQLSRYSMQRHRFRPSWPHNGTGTGTGSAYCSGMGEHDAIPAANSTAIGTAYENTTAMVQNCVPNNAGNAARAYSGGRMTDWSLPSSGELAALQNAPNVQSIGGIAGAYYWSSTQSSGSENADMMQFLNGTWSTDPKSSSHGVRPVRTF